MQHLQNLWSGLRLKDKPLVREPDPIIHSFQTAGTPFPILVGRPETESWLSSAPLATQERPIQVGIASRIGQRDKNEDTGLVFLSQVRCGHNQASVCFAIVADGMGGHWGGEFASSIAAKTVAECVMGQVILADGPDQQPCTDLLAIGDILADAMTSAHEMVQFNVPDGGTTATCALIIDDQAHIAHVGDSRAYVMNDGRMTLQTKDHSLVHILQEEGGLTPEQARVHSQRNVLYRSLGMDEDFQVDSLTYWLEPASLVLLCSDGLWDALDDEQIARIIIEAGVPQAACEKLVGAAVEADGSDNVTAILVQMPE